MPVSPQQRRTVEAMFKAMQAGPDGEESMVSLFADDAVLSEPFSGQAQTHAGKPAIRQSFRDQWKDPPPDLALVIDRIDLDGVHVRADWTCTSPVFPSPMRGYDLFTLDAAGKIKRLEIIVTEAPPIGH